jgi:hypothetical protein
MGHALVRFLGFKDWLIFMLLYSHIDWHFDMYDISFVRSA